MLAIQAASGVIVMRPYYMKKNRLLLVEAVTSHGASRRKETCRASWAVCRINGWAGLCNRLPQPGYHGTAPEGNRLGNRGMGG